MSTLCCDAPVLYVISALSKKCHKLRMHHLKAFIDFVEQGNTLQSHDNVPGHIREQLVAEEQQQLEQQPSVPANAPARFPPINITNMLLSSYQPAIAGSVDSVAPPAAYLSSIPSLDIPGPRDAAVRMYSEWQQSKILDEDWKMDFQTACDVALSDGLGLELVHTAQELNFFIEKGVKRGLA